jgi:hypothetical protein
VGREVGVERGIGAGLDEVDVLLDLLNQRQEYMVHIHNDWYNCGSLSNT